MKFLHAFILVVQWNPVNQVTNGPQKSGRITEWSYKGIRKQLTEFFFFFKACWVSIILYIIT